MELRARQWRQKRRVIDAATEQHHKVCHSKKDNMSENSDVDAASLSLLSYSVSVVYKIGGDAPIIEIALSRRH